MRKYNREIPKCTKSKNHNWKDSVKKYGETGICTRCGYDVFEDNYRED